MQFLKKMQNNTEGTGGGDVTGNTAFMDEITAPAKPAVDTPAVIEEVIKEPVEAGGWPGSEWFSGKKTEEQKEPAPEPVFKLDDESPEAKANVSAAAAKVLEEKSVRAVRNFITSISSLQGLGLAKLAAINDFQKYKYSENEIEVFVEALLPYADQIEKMMPTWLPLIVAIATITAPKVMSAVAEGKINRANAQVVAEMKQTPAATMQAAAGKVVPFTAPVQKGERSKHAIHSNGYYQYPRGVGGSYLKISEATEKPNLQNAEEMKQVIHVNTWDKVQRIFNLPDDYCEKMGIKFED